MFELRDYQKELSAKCLEILKKHSIVLLAAEVRTGKTFVALDIAKNYKAKNVLFITKKKAMSSISDDYKHYENDYHLTIINYESLHKVKGKFDLIILDEIHGTLAGYPKPSKSFKLIKKEFLNVPKVMLSGTPLIESASKAYPIFAILKNGPWKDYANFYKWFKIFGIPKVVYTPYGQATDYSNVKYNDVMSKIGHLIVSFTQEQAGFTTKITETILKVKMKDSTYGLIKRLIKDRVIEGENDVILADTSVKLQSSLHQMYSGTIKLDSGAAITLDDSKAKFIKEYFKDKKIAILYNFIQEKKMLEDIFGDNITNDLEEFNTTNKKFYGQIVATREGVSLKEADALIFFNMPFSGTSFVQGKDRLSFKDRTENNVYYIFAEGGIEEKIYAVVKDKQNFTNKIFKKDYGNI